MKRLLLALCLCAVLPFLSAVAQDTRPPEEVPYVGISLDGNQIWRVAFESGADAVGILVGDYLLEANGITINAIEDLTTALEGCSPGDDFPVTIRRGEADDPDAQILDLVIVLGSRRDAVGPMGRGGRTEYRSNADIFPELVDYQDDFTRAFAEYLTDEDLNTQWLAELQTRRDRRAANGDAPDPRLEDRNLIAEWEALVAALTREMEAHEGFYRLDRTAYVMRNPLHMEAVARAVTAPIETAAGTTEDLEHPASPNLAAIVQAMAIARDLPMDGIPNLFEPQYPESLMVGPTERVVRLWEAVGYALTRAWEQAFSDLSQEEIDFLEEWLPRVMTKFREHIYIDAGLGDTPENREVLRNYLRAVDLSKKVQYLYLAHATALATMAVSATGELVRSFLHPEAGQLPAYMECETEYGLIIIANDTSPEPTNRVFDQEAFVILSNSGDNVYRGDAVRARGAGKFQFIIDMDGNDRYEGGDYSVGCALLGGAVIADFNGADFYETGMCGLGMGLGGFGIIHDQAGNDRMIGDSLCMGAGCFGFGLLVDSHGNDLRHAHKYACGLGLPGGVGLLLDQSGEDTSIANNEDFTGYGSPEGEWQGWSFGFGIGFRTIAAGGMGIYLDLAGNDLISAGEFSVGGAYFLGFGIFKDNSGQDIYHSSRYGSGFGVHQAVGIQIDDAGDDTYESQTAASIGSSWDIGVGWLIDSAGDDTYVADGLGLGGAAQNGFALLWDRGGNDLYRSRSRGATLGGGSSFEYGEGRGAKNFALLLDWGGGHDIYQCFSGSNNQAAGDADNLRRINGTIGILDDR